MRKQKVTYEEFMDICKGLEIEPHRLFGCLRRSLGISQAKLAYRLDHEHINQNTISKYEHKNNISTDYEYILWCFLIKTYNSLPYRSKSDQCRYAVVLFNAINLYVLKYATPKQTLMISQFMSEAFKIVR